MKQTFFLCAVFFSFISHAAPIKEEIKLKTLNFVAPVNIKAFTCRGEAKKLEGHLVRQGLEIKELKVRVPVESLTTHMSLRDEHMVERIFTTKEGKVPDLEFTSSKSHCEKKGENQFQCEVLGEFKIQGTKKELTLNIDLETKKDLIASAKMNGILKLKDFGIKPPSHLGVRVKNEIKLSGEFLVQ